MRLKTRWCAAQWVSMTTGSKTPGVPLENTGTHEQLDKRESVGIKIQCMSVPVVNSVPGGELRPAEGGGPIFADKQSQVAVWIKARNPHEKLPRWHANAVLKLNPPTWSSAWPSLLLLSEKFWLWTIFSTMSSASMRVSSTQLGCLSTVSFFLLLQGKKDTNRDEMDIWNTPQEVTL